MIKIIFGNPGSGKSYYALYHILKLHYDYDDLIGKYTPKHPLVIVSNFKDLAIDHVVLGDLMGVEREVEFTGKDGLQVKLLTKGLRSVFSSECIDSLRLLYHCKTVIFLIDEAQSPSLFHKKFYDEHIFFFFEYHRHFGADVYLLTQNLDSMPKQIVGLAEETIKAVSRTFGSGSTFRYKFMVDWECTRSVIVRRKQEIFRVYSSFETDETEKPTSIYRRYLLLAGGFILFSAIMFKFFFLHNFVGSADSHKKSLSSPVSRSASGVSGFHLLEYREDSSHSTSSPLHRPFPVSPSPVIPNPVVPPVFENHVSVSIPPKLDLCMISGIIQEGDDRIEIKDCGNHIEKWKNGFLSSSSVKHSVDVSSSGVASYSAPIAHLKPL